MDTVSMINDIASSKQENLDKLIVFLHWGTEYVSQPTQEQEAFAHLLFEKGADVIIGSHPHVIQKMEYYTDEKSGKERFIAYSLGNFVSNQRNRKRDGGGLVQLNFEKDHQSGKTIISDCGYHLTWVHKPLVNGKYRFEIVSCPEKEKNGFEGMRQGAQDRMKLFYSDSRKFLNSENINVKEYKTN